MELGIHPESSPGDQGTSEDRGGWDRAGSSGDARQHRQQGGCWYPPSAYLYPPDESSGSGSSSGPAAGPYDSWGPQPPCPNALYPVSHCFPVLYHGPYVAVSPLAQGYFPQQAFQPGLQLQYACTIPVMVPVMAPGMAYPPYPPGYPQQCMGSSQHSYSQQHWDSSGYSGEQHYGQSYPEASQVWEEDGGSDAGGSCAREGSAASAGASSYLLDPAQEAHGWGSITASVFHSVLSKLVDGDVKSIRLVCRHWRAVFDHNVEQLTPSAMMSKLIVLRFPNLRILHLTNCANVRNRDLMTLAQSGLRLHTLTLGDDANKPWVTNKGLACISQIPSLTSLNLQDCNNVTNNGLLALNKLTCLQALSLKGCNKLTNSGLETLQRNTALTSLNLFGCRHVADQGLLSLSNLSLITLTLGGTRVRDQGLAHLAKMTSLQELHFEKEGVTDAGIRTLSSLTNLQSLALRDCSDVSGDSLSSLIPQLTKLQSLDLYKNFSIDDSQLFMCLEFLGNVTFLDLRGTFVTEDGLQQLTRLSSLQKLCLAPTQGGELWGQYMCVISNLTQLTSLTINNCQLISCPVANSLRQLKQLRELDISDEEHLEVSTKPPVNHAAVDMMATITSLTSIDLSRRPVHEDHLSVLAERLPRLHTLIIVGCPVLSSEVQALQRRFPELVIHRKPLLDVSCGSSDHGGSAG